MPKLKGPRPKYAPDYGVPKTCKMVEGVPITPSEALKPLPEGVVPEQSALTHSPNPMVRAFGEGPEDKRCGICRHATDKEERNEVKEKEGGRYVVQVTPVIACDQREEAGWRYLTLKPHEQQACARWEEKEG